MSKEELKAAEADDLLRQARIFTQNGDRARALKLANKAIKIYPTDQAFSVKAGALRGLKHYKQAEIAARKALELNPDNLMAQFTLLNILDPQLQREETLEEFRAIASKRPQTSSDLRAIIFALEDLGHTEKAEALYFSALRDYKFASSDPFLLYDLGCTLIEKGLHSQAEAIFIESIRLEPRSISALHNLASALHSQNKFQEAESALIKELKLAPKDLSGLSLMTTVLYNRGKLAEAAEYAKKLPKKDAETYFIRGRIEGSICCGEDIKPQAQKKLLKSTLQNYDKAIKLDPTNILYLCSKAEILLSLGKDDEAAIFASKAFNFYRDPDIRAAQDDAGYRDKAFVENTLAKFVPDFRVIDDTVDEGASSLQTMTFAFDDAFYSKKDDPHYRLKVLGDHNHDLHYHDTDHGPHSIVGY